MTTLTVVDAPMQWSRELEVSVLWDSRMQEIIRSIMQGIDEARRGEGRLLTDSDLPTDDDDE